MDTEGPRCSPLPGLLCFAVGIYSSSRDGDAAAPNRQECHRLRCGRHCKMAYSVEHASSRPCRSPRQNLPGLSGASAPVTSSFGLRPWPADLEKRSPSPRIRLQDRARVQAAHVPAPALETRRGASTRIHTYVPAFRKKAWPVRCAIDGTHEASGTTTATGLHAVRALRAGPSFLKSFAMIPNAVQPDPDAIRRSVDPRDRVGRARRTSVLHVHAQQVFEPRA